MNIYIEDTYQELSRHAARFVEDEIEKIPNLVLGLPTGETPIGMYEKLVKRYKAGKVDFSPVTTFNLDEYVGLSSQNPGSYHYYMHTHFFDDVNIDPTNIFIPHASSPKDKQAGKLYEDAIREKGGIDFLILGIGRNGHIGFNEPGSPFSSRTRIVTLAAETRDNNSQFFPNGEKVPTHAITMGMATIMKARKIMLLAAGESKKNILYQALKKPITDNVPASILQRHPDLTVIADMQTGSLLKH